MTRKFILTINPGSTSTKLAVYEGEKEIFTRKVAHSTEELRPFATVCDQYGLRTKLVSAVLAEAHIDPASLLAVVGRGGILRPIPSGTYEVTPRMLDELRAPVKQHASNLGALMADEIARQAGCKAYIVDPVVVDEMQDIARLSGHPEISRTSVFHALNHKRIARNAARALGKPYEAVNLIVAHMGGGISVALHEKGKVVDVNNALDGEGPFSPERAGGVPWGKLVEMCFAPGASEDAIRRKLIGAGGMTAYLGTNDAVVVAGRIDAGDTKAKMVIDAMAYQVAKDIGAMAAVARGAVDAIALTGGLAHDSYLTDEITARVRFLAQVLLFPGEDEMRALCDGVLRVLQGAETVRIY